MLCLTRKKVGVTECSYFQLTVEKTGMVLHMVYVSMKQWSSVVGISLCSIWVRSCCHPTPGWLDSTNVCMSGGWWSVLLKGGATVDIPPLLCPHAYVVSEIANFLFWTPMSQTLRYSTVILKQWESIDKRHILQRSLIGVSLSEPHTSVTSLRTRVCIYACLDWPLTENFK